MSRIDERTSIQQEIKLLESKLSDDRNMIQYNFTTVIDQLNPIKKIQASIIYTIDHTIEKLNFIKPLVLKMQKLFKSNDVY